MLGDEYVHELAVLVNGPVHLPPVTVEVHMRLIYEPAVTDGMPSRPVRIDLLRSGPLHPPKQSDVIHLGTARIDEAPDPVRKAVPRVPADRQQDHLRRETEPGERRRSLHGRPRTPIALHPATLTATRRSVKATVPARSAPSLVPRSFRRRRRRGGKTWAYASTIVCSLGA